MQIGARMRNIPGFLIMLVAVGLVTPGSAQAQNIGGGTIDLQNGAAGSNQPSSNVGQRFVPAQAGAPDPDDEVPQAPPPPAPKKKKAKARKPKAAVVAPNQN